MNSNGALPPFCGPAVQVEGREKESPNPTSTRYAVSSCTSIVWWSITVFGPSANTAAPIRMTRKPSCSSSRGAPLFSKHHHHATDDLGEHDILIDRHRDPMEHVEVLERHGDEMGVLESNGPEVEHVEPFGTDPFEIRIDSRHEVGHTLARCASLRPSRIS